MYRTLAELTVLVHFGFIVFVVLGGFLARRRRWLVPVHLVAVVWGLYVELMPGAVCPLTTWENHFAARAGLATYDEGFIARYLLPVIYPAGLTRGVQIALAGIVIAMNLIAYAPLLRRRKPPPDPGSP